jgi:hypothetical protein
MASVSSNPFAIEYVTLVAPHPPEECLQRIRDSIYTVFALPLSRDEMPFSGIVFSKRFTLWRYRRGGWRGIHTVAVGHAQPDQVRGTVIRLRVSLPFGLYFWLAAMSVILLGFIPALVSHALGSADPFGVVFGLLVAGFFVAAVVSLWRQRSDRAFLVDTLTRLLNAEVSP